MEKSDVDIDVKKQHRESKPEYRHRADVLEGYARRLRDGETISIADILESPWSLT